MPKSFEVEIYGELLLIGPKADIYNDELLLKYIQMLDRVPYELEHILKPKQLKESINPLSGRVIYKPKTNWSQYLGNI